MRAIRAMHAMPINENGVPYVPIPVNTYQSLNLNSLMAWGKKTIFSRTNVALERTTLSLRVSCPTAWAYTIIYSSNQKWPLNRCSFIFEFFRFQSASARIHCSNILTDNINAARHFVDYKNNKLRCLGPEYKCINWYVLQAVQFSPCNNIVPERGNGWGIPKLTKKSIWGFLGAIFFNFCCKIVRTWSRGWIPPRVIFEEKHAH